MIYQSEVGPIHFSVDGPPGAPAVAFTHGAGLDSRMFDPQVRALSVRYRTLVWDMPGHGKSGLLAGPFPFEKVAGILVGILREIGAGPAVLVGQSLGSWVSQHAAVLHPDRVTGVVSIGGTPLHAGVGRGELLMYRVALALSRLVPGKPMYRWTARKKATTEAARRYARSAMGANGKQQFLRIAAGMLEAGTLGIDTVPDQPLLIVHGEKEWPNSVVKLCRAWHAETPGSRYAVIPGAGHNANQDNPPAFNQELFAFLAQVADGDLKKEVPSSVVDSL